MIKDVGLDCSKVTFQICESVVVRIVHGKVTFICFRVLFCIASILLFLSLSCRSKKSVTFRNLQGMFSSEFKNRSHLRSSPS